MQACPRHRTEADGHDFAATCPFCVFEAERIELLDAVEDAVLQSCATELEGVFDSMAISSLADAMRLLAKHGRLVIETEVGRRVIARRKK